MSKLMKRTHMCGSLRADDEGKNVIVNGWIAKRRNLGGLIFCDVRDRTGIVQVVFNDDIPAELFDKADSLRSEFVVGVSGTVRIRESKNMDIPTGEIEIFADDLEIYSTSETPPIYVKDDDNVDDNLRLKYRYLDLRKQQMQDNLAFRHKVVKICRDYYDENGFLEVETPILIKSTPEGARDYVVPSRVHGGEFYALPQSPQMFKQLLMVSGCDRYMQIAKCFRDEDLRADRQPEFTQIDLEMSFVDEDDVIEMQEGFIKRLMKETKNVDVELPLPRLTYEEAMDRYGSDKPDTRFGFELKNLTEVPVVAAVSKEGEGAFPPFVEAVNAGGSIRGICIEGGADEYTRKKIDKLTEHIKTFGAKGMVWIKAADGDWTSSVNKFFDQDGLKAIGEVFGAKAGDMILIVSGPSKVVFDSLGFLRRHIAGELGLLDDNQFNFLWVTDFPLFEYDEAEGRFQAMHHPFTAPKDEDIDKVEGDPAGAHAKAYDIVLNGVELGGGSIRIHDRELQSHMFKALGLSDEEIEAKFGFLVEAFKYGAPPHGGLAYGLDRMVMLLAGADSIREVMAFPKNQSAQCMVCGAPAPIEKDQLEELYIDVVENVQK
ncbi:MAG: aspartate--tRNA ligase [Firmicutes bacterium]|nr:aspartate--tRNA ligase [Bacillota bacterium]